jgi:hypothetical protein
MSEKTRIPMLIDEEPVIVYPSLATAIGINEAIIIQQLHFLLNITQKSKNKHNYVNGAWWVYNSYAEWQRDYFPWLAESTIKRLFLWHEQQGYVKSIQSVKHKSDRRKWYTIDYEKWRQFTDTIVSKRDDGSSYQKETMVVSKRDDGYSENTSETTHTLSADAAAGAKPKKEKTPRERDELIDTITTVLFNASLTDTASVKQAAILAAWIRGTSTGTKSISVGKNEYPSNEPKDVTAFVKWWNDQHDGAHPPTSISKFPRWWRQWKASGGGKVDPYAGTFAL